MKLRFKCECVDKHTGQTYRRLGVYEFDDDRAKEILATGRAEEVKEKAVEPAEPVAKSVQEKTAEERLDDGELVNLMDLKKSELIEMAKKVGVSTRGSKEDIIERLLESAEVENDD
jgi:hypothetical protein